MDEKKDVLAKLKKTSILATDIAGQYWCERQTELNYIYGKKYTAAMQRGSKLHKELQDELETTISIEPQNYADFLYKETYENYLTLRSLNEKGIGREMKVYGLIDGFKISGKIDELVVKNGKVVVTEIKTRDLNAKIGRKASDAKQISETTMRTNKMQVMLYKRLLTDLREKNYTYEMFQKLYSVNKLFLSQNFMDQLKILGLDTSIGLDGIYKMMFEQIYRMPQISEVVELRYIDRYTGEPFASFEIEYKKEEFERMLNDSMGYWKGERESRPVVEAESWKCRFCKFFGNECKVWWSG